MSGTDKSLEERRKYIQAFNATMVKIWREQISLLGVVDTGALYRSVAGIGYDANGKITAVTLLQRFNLYGLYVDYGTGSNTPIGNPGDIKRDNRRQRRKWFSKKHYASVMNIREFFADNLGKELANVLSNTMTANLSRRFA